MEILEKDKYREFMEKVEKDKKSNISTVIIRIGLLIFLITVLGILITFISRKYENTWYFYSCIEKKRILSQQKKSEEYMAHLKQSFK
jgi:flagellar basal body-associated protein FliL